MLSKDKVDIAKAALISAVFVSPSWLNFIRGVCFDSKIIFYYCSFVFISLMVIIYLLRNHSYEIHIKLLFMPLLMFVPVVYWKYWNFILLSIFSFVLLLVIFSCNAYIRRCADKPVFVLDEIKIYLYLMVFFSFIPGLFIKEFSENILAYNSWHEAVLAITYRYILLVSAVFIFQAFFLYLNFKKGTGVR